MSDPDAAPGSDRQVESLRRVAEASLVAYDLDVADISLITNDWNGVFRVYLTDGSRRVVRVGLPGRRTRTQVDAEMGWLDALARAASVSVPIPVSARDGSFVIEATADGVDGSRLCAVFAWIEGEPIEDHLTAANLERAGEAAAHLHEHARTFPVPIGLPAWDTPFPYGEAVVLFDAEHASSLSDHEVSVFLAVREATEAAIARLAEAEPPRMLHADLHEHNLFVDGDVVRVLDFDDSMPGWPAQDLSVIWFELAEQDNIEALMLALRRGYERVAAWPERVPGEIAVFAANRALHLANYVVQDHDPEYRARAPELVRAWARRAARFLEETGP
ncbi:MAG: phosphotransferase enzyme family protein [Actinomycetota bacterium]